MTSARTIKWVIMRVVSATETPGCGCSARWLSERLVEPYQDVARACKLLATDGLLWHDRGGYRLTEDGRRALAGIPTGSSTNATEERAWVQEARSGMHSSGRQSAIDCAAVPATMDHRAGSDYSELMRRRLERAGITIDDLVAGRVIECPKCRQIMLTGQECCGGEKK